MSRPERAGAARAISAGEAVAAAVAVAEEHGITVREPVVLTDSYNLRIHLRPAPVVARVPTVTALARLRPEEAMRRELAVVSFLHGRGAPVVPPSDLLPARVHEHGGTPVSYWQYVEHVEHAEHVEHDGSPVTPEAFGRALRELHEELRGFPGALPRLGPVLDEPRHLLGLLSGELEPDVLARLAEARDGLAARLPDGGQAVHGDAHPGNLLVTPGGLLWNDFEETMSAPVGWDLACLLRTVRLDGRAAVRAYGADPDDPALAVFTEARTLQAVLWTLVRALRFPEERAAARATLDGWLRDPTRRTR
ncbi:aminoglycoside phosphotransferase family protein [Nonomuraea sp. NPDC049607]|uniref:aminoglycoside phosphotransferase family protein n=1 Tax=Nonomuraea sp. NPDC049607 TaxID=3154732 RepID=UPI0034259DA4